MYDSFGDGWNGATYTLGGNTTLTGTTTGTLNSGYGPGINTFNVTGGPTCVVDDLRYEITVAFYRECANGVNAPTNIQIRWEVWATNNGGGYSSADLARSQGRLQDFFGIFGGLTFA